MTDEPPVYPRRGAVVRWLSGFGFSSYEVRIMFEDGTIVEMPKRRVGERARFSREQIRRAVLAKFIEAGAAGCDSSPVTLAREVKAKSKREA